MRRPAGSNLGDRILSQGRQRGVSKLFGEGTSSRFDPESLDKAENYIFWQLYVNRRQPQELESCRVKQLLRIQLTLH